MRTSTSAVRSSDASEETRVAPAALRSLQAHAPNEDSLPVSPLGSRADSTMPSSAANDHHSCPPAPSASAPLSTVNHLETLRGRGNCSTCTTCSVMSSDLSINSMASDDDGAQDEEDDEELAGGNGGTEEDAKHKFRLKVLNFNVFAGSPIPMCFQSVTPKTASLEGSERLKLQVERIRALGPDIICLQEACSDGVERYYREAFADLYDSFFEEHPPETLGKLTLGFVYLVMATVLAFCFHCVLDLWASSLTLIIPFGPSVSSTFALPSLFSSFKPHHWSRDDPYDSTRLLLVLALVGKGLGVAVWSMRKTCLVGFLQGQVKASTVILWRRDRFSVVYNKDPVTQALVPAEMRTTFFQEQRGDWLNLVRPRGYLTAQLLFHGMPLYIVNTHLNLGQQVFRRRQVEELTQHCKSLSQVGSVVLCGDFNVTPESEEIQLLSKQAGVKDALLEKGCSEPTWSSRNPLTHGVLLEEDHRCDFIFYKGLARQHRMVNRRCRLDVPFWGNTWLSDHFGIVLDMILEPVLA